MTRIRPEGGTLHLVLDRWVSQVEREVAKKQGGFREDSAFFSLVEGKIVVTVDALRDMVHGFELARFLWGYHPVGAEGDDEKKERILEWSHEEYENKREARETFGINLIVSDGNQYDYPKLSPQFFHRASYAGTSILLDETASLCKIPNTIARQYDYKVLLTIYNGIVQGKAQHIDIWMGATPEALEDKRRGLFSYEALSPWLAESHFFRMGSRDLFLPALRLEVLTPEEMLMLAEKLSVMHATLHGDARCFRADELELFVRTCYVRVGMNAQLTPRGMTRSFIFLLDALYREPESSMEQLLKPKAGDAALESVASELRKTGDEDDMSFDLSF